MSRVSSPEKGFLRTGALHVEARLAALGVRHGVTTRALGNMKSADSRRKALAAAGLSGDALLLKQVHGTAILETASLAGVEDARQADGWITAEPGVTVAVYVADCLPIFVWDRQGAAAGVFHAGWRGLAAGMPRAAARAFRRFGIGPERLAAAVGPHAGACCYAVGPDVASKFGPEAHRSGKLDLGAEARRQLQESGVASEHVSVSEACTVCSAEEFFSYRREKADRRMLAFLSIAERPHGS